MVGISEKSQKLQVRDHASSSRAQAQKPQRYGFGKGLVDITTAQQVLSRRRRELRALTEKKGVFESFLLI